MFFSPLISLSGDVFLLDCGLTLYQWQGKHSSGLERMKAGLLCRAIDEERAGKPELVTISETDAANLDPHVALFWSLIPGGVGPIRDADDLDESCACEWTCAMCV